MQIGLLDRRIRIESKVVTQDVDYGTEVVTWTPFKTVWASVLEVLPSKGENQAQGIRIAERPARVRIRYTTGITSDMRVIYLYRDNRIMKILTPPVEIGRKDFLEFFVADYSTQGDAA